MGRLRSLVVVSVVFSASVTPTRAAPEIGIAPLALTQNDYVFDSAEQHRIGAHIVVRGLKHPFAVALLPAGDALISERGGALRLVHQAAGHGGAGSTLDPQPLSGVPAFEPSYPGAGLHDVVLHPDFSHNHLVYFTFNKPGNSPPGDAKPPVRHESRVSLFRGTLEGHGLTHVQELFVAESGGTTSGSRIAFGKDGAVFMSTGAPFGDQAPQLNSSYGKILRLSDSGGPAPGNPFVGQANALPQLYSIGHRDTLGLAVHPLSGALLNAEHGPNGGDEINVILPGKNYGWPRVSFGRSYEGPRISDSPTAEGIEPPVVVWLPSIAPSGLVVYSGSRFASWRGNLFVGSARRGEVPRTGGLERVVFNDKLEELRRETLLTDLHQRIRDVRQGDDGLLYVLTDEEDGALIRLEPAP